MTAKTGHKTPKDVGFFKLEVSTEVAGEIAGMSAERIRQLTKEGWIEKLGPNRYLAAAVVSGVLAYKDDQIARLSRAGSSSKLQDARAAEIEVRTAERLKTLQRLGRDEGLAVVDAVLGPMRSDLQSVPARVTKDLALRRRLEGELNGVLDSAADRARTFRRRPPADDEPAGNRHARRAAAAEKRA